MANYATNIFYARTENKADLDKIEAFLDDTFDGFVNRHSDSVDAEFTSRWVYPEEEILSYEFTDEYVSFRIFSQGKWDIKL